MHIRRVTKIAKMNLNFLNKKKGRRDDQQVESSQAGWFVILRGFGSTRKTMKMKTEETDLKAQKNAPPIP